MGSPQGRAEPMHDLQRHCGARRLPPSRSSDGTRSQAIFGKVRKRWNLRDEGPRCPSPLPSPRRPRRPLAPRGTSGQVCAFAKPTLMDARSEFVVTADRLAKVYKTSVAVDGISFALARGSITGLLGGNGAGKTTTIAMLMGLVTPTSGDVRVLGATM